MLGNSHAFMYIHTCIYKCVIRAHIYQYIIYKYIHIYKKKDNIYISIYRDIVYIYIYIYSYVFVSSRCTVCILMFFRMYPYGSHTDLYAPICIHMPPLHMRMARFYPCSARTHEKHTPTHTQHT